MEKITITIPDNLSASEEIIMIMKKLGKKYLPKSGKETKMLGNGYQIKDLETQIIIKRESTEKPIVTCTCSVCNTDFEKTLGKTLFVNYGGVTKKRLLCSDECRQFVLNITGEGRASKTKKMLKSCLKR